MNLPSTLFYGSSTLASLILFFLFSRHNFVVTRLQILGFLCLSAAWILTRASFGWSTDKDARVNVFNDKGWCVSLRDSDKRPIGDARD